MTREELKQFFADVKLCTNISMGYWLDRNQIFRSEFTNFMKGKYNNISNYELNLLAIDIMTSLKSFVQIYEKVA